MRLERDGSAYKFVPATGMYKRETGDGPVWFDPEGSQENFLEARGWGVISRPGADANDESAEDFVGDGAVPVLVFSRACLQQLAPVVALSELLQMLRTHEPWLNQRRLDATEYPIELFSVAGDD